MSEDNVVPLKPEPAFCTLTARERLAKYEPEALAAMDALDDWAGARLQSGQEPPWTWYELMKLRDAISKICGPRADEVEVNLP